MKTVLAPGAPWPVYEKPLPKPRPLQKKIGRSALIDKKFEEWLNKATPIKLGFMYKLHKSNKNK